MKVSEIFMSIQGEGRYVGNPQVFIRFVGCNLRCSWCDTKYAYRGGKEMTIDEIVGKVKEFGLKSVCVTGGEPMLQSKELTQLIKRLKVEGFEIILETNGTLYDEEVFRTVDCVSLDIKPPSSGEESDIKILKKLGGKDQVKIVVKDERDYEFAKEISKKTDLEIILQPEGMEGMRKWCERVLEDRIGFRILPQMHKVIGLK